MSSFKLLNIGILISSLFCYLEWPNNSAFLFEIEYGLFFYKEASLQAFAHPLVLIPIIGQILLLISLFKKKENYKLTFSGMAFLSSIVLILLLVGILSLNIKIVLSVLPFLCLCFLTIKLKRKQKQNS